MQNKKKLLSVLFGLSLMSQAALAENLIDSMNAQLAMADVDGFSNGMALVIGAERKMPQIHPKFSVEGQFTTSISDPDTKIGNTNIEASYYTLAGYGVFTHPVQDKLNLRVKAGLLYEDVSVTASSGSFNASGSDSDIGFSFGFGGLIQLDEKLDVIVEYTIIESDISHLSGGVKYSF